jgi:hypothetical protein
VSALARWATALAVLVVATIAASVSFDHVESLALSHGYSIDTARLLPFSVDGLIVAASMALMTGARPSLARVALVLGIAASVWANLAYGARYGITGEVLSAWPAVAFLVSSEILVGMLRARPAITAGSAASIPLAGDAAEAVAAQPSPATSQDVTEDVPVTVPQDVTHEAPEDVPEIAVVTVPASTVYPVPARRARTVAARPAPATRAKRQADPARIFAAELAEGKVPSLRSIKTAMHVGTPAAQEVRARLVAIMETPQAA